MDRMAVLKEWGTRNNVTIAKIPAGTKVKYAIGSAKEQLRLQEIRPGGGKQLLFEKFDESWIIQTAKLP